MKDRLSAKQRLSPLIDYTGRECMGCGRLSDEMAISDGWTDDDFENNSRRTAEGNWYCHIDCFRDSR